jgi:pimeloyl-ACP methyl ester carboxylesterase
MILLGLVMTLLLTTGALDLYLGSLQTQRWRENLRTNRTPFQLDYYLFVPQTPPPPEGWGLLLLLHDYGANAESLLPSFVQGAAESGVILIAPTLGAYAEPLDTMTLPAIDALLIEVRAEYPANPQGAVLFGYGSGGTVATYYAREYFRVAAVATVSTPQVFPPPSDDPKVVYLFMYGTFDTNRNAAELSIARFHESSNPLEVLTMPGADERVTAEQVRLTLELAQKVYFP